MKQLNAKLNGNKEWWLAINGPSCAASPCSLTAEGLNVIPVPEQMFGYSSQREQLETQQLLLKSSMRVVQCYIDSLPRRVRKGEIALAQPHNPETPTRGPTMWLAERLDPVTRN